MSHTSMQLYPLSPDEARTLAGHLMPMLCSGQRGTADRVVITAEGNPLFIEELVAPLAERVEEVTEGLPTNVRTTIAARLDTLPAGARGVLLDAAVIGKVFWRGALQALDAGRRPSLRMPWTCWRLVTSSVVSRGARSRATTNTCSNTCSSGRWPTPRVPGPQGAARRGSPVHRVGVRRADRGGCRPAGPPLAGEAGDVDQAVRFLQLAAEHACQGMGER
jgi:hypothetical protein